MAETLQGVSITDIESYLSNIGYESAPSIDF